MEKKKGGGKGIEERNESRRKVWSDGKRLMETREMYGEERGGGGTLGGHLSKRRGEVRKKGGVTHTEGGERDEERIAALGDTVRTAEVFRLWYV